MFDVLHGVIIDAVEAQRAKKVSSQVEHDSVENDDNPASPDEPNSTEAKPRRQGKLFLDATVVNQAIRCPTDQSLLNEGRAFSETIIADDILALTVWVIFFAGDVGMFRTFSS